MDTHDHHTDDQRLSSVVAEPANPPGTFRVRSKLDDPALGDLGWHTDPSLLPPCLIKGVSNDDLFMLIRRFNKQVVHVRAIPPPPPGVLDLEIPSDEEFSPDKLRANVERLYMTVVIGLASFGKHVARLRSWNEPRRTAKFAVVYFLAWYLSFLPALVITTLLVLVLHPPSRHTLFPPAPLAAVSASSGNLQVPRAGTLGSPDSLSGAPEAHAGEAVEHEASHFVAGLGAIGAGALMGQGGAPKRKVGEARADVLGDAAGELETEAAGDMNASEDAFVGAVPDPSDLVLQAKNVKDAAHTEGAPDAGAAVAKKSVEGAMWEKARPVMRAIADVADTWERFANLLEPVPPFPVWTGRLRLAAVLVPLLLVALTVSAEMVVDGTTLALGLGFFGQPAITRGAYYVTHRFPHWRQVLELRRTLLRGVPTNAQLALTLLRVAEAARSPLPPPPASTLSASQVGSNAQPAPAHPPQAGAELELKAQDFAFDTSNYEVEGVDENHARAQDEGYAGGETDTETDTDESAGGGEGKTKKHHSGRRLVGFLKRTTRAGVGGVLGVDHLKAKAGSEHAKRRLGAVAPPEEKAGDTGGKPGIASVVRADLELARGSGEDKTLKAEDEMKREGPTAFSARFQGRRGRVMLVESAASPCVAFVPEKRVRGALGLGAGTDAALEAEFSVGLADVRSVRKMGGFGWKGKIVVGWATGREVLDGLEIVDGAGTRRVVTAIKGRDQLFNRIVAVGGSWECL